MFKIIEALLGKLSRRAGTTLQTPETRGFERFERIAPIERNPLVTLPSLIQRLGFCRRKSEVVAWVE
jgi:hypothetical protein